MIAPGAVQPAPYAFISRNEYPDSEFGASVYTALTATTAINDKQASIFQAPRAGSITAITFRTGTVTTGATVDVRLETVNASGDPSGTLKSTTTNASYVLVAGTDSNQLITVTLTSAYTCTKGEMLAVVIVNPGASPGSWTLRGTVGGNASQLPYGDRSVTGVWTKNATAPSIGLKYGTVYPKIGGLCLNGGVVTAPLSTAFNNTSANREAGNRFVAPAAWRVTGMWAYITNASNVAYDTILYQGTTAVLTRSNVGVEHKAAGLCFTDFNSTFTLIPGQVYRVVFKPTTATSISYDQITVDTAAMMQASSGSIDVYQTIKDNAGNWTDTTTNWTMCGVIYDAIGV